MSRLYTLSVGKISTQKRRFFLCVDPATNVHIRRRETTVCVRGENAAPKEEGDAQRTTTTTPFVVESVVGDGVDKVAKRFRRL